MQSRLDAIVSHAVVSETRFPDKPDSKCISREITKTRFDVPSLTEPGHSDNFQRCEFGTLRIQSLCSTFEVRTLTASGNWMMKDVFKGWRRKVGVATLAMACALMCVCLRRVEVISKQTHLPRQGMCQFR